MVQANSTYMYIVYDRVYAVCMGISLPKIPYIHHIYMVQANPVCVECDRVSDLYNCLRHMLSSKSCMTATQGFTSTIHQLP